MGFVVPLAAAGLRIEAQPLMGGHRAFRIAFDDVEVADPRAVLAGLGGAGLAADGSAPDRQRRGGLAVAGPGRRR